MATTEQTTQNTCATTCPTTWRGAMSSYDAYGQMTSTTDGRGVSVDANGNATLADPGGQYTGRTNYDAQGDRTSSSTPPITTTLNGITTTAPVSSVTAYDADGNPTLQVDANGAQTTTTDDHLSRPIATGRPAVRLWDGTTPATRVTTATVDDNAQGAGQDQFSYAGTWGHCANCGPSLYGRSNSWDGTANESATLAFSGTAVALYGVKDTNNGIAAVSLDGGAETMVDLYATARTYTVLIWSAGGLAAGRHTLKVRVTGTKNVSSSGYYVGPDRADIGAPSAPAGTTTYDAAGNAVAETDANGGTTLSGYDPLGRLVSQTNPVSGTTLMTYTADELTTQQDAQGNVTGYGYDAAGRPVQMTNPVTGTTGMAYDAAGNTTALTTTDRTAGNAVVTLEQMGYDALNRAITSTVYTNTANIAGSALTTLNAYDLDGNVAQTVQPNGDVTYNVYDAADRLTNVEIDPAPLTKAQAATHPSYEAYSYDGAGNQTFAQDADIRATTTQYDGAGRLTQSVAASTAPTGTTTITTTTQYDPDGNAVQQITRTVDSTSPGQVQTHVTTSSYNAADWETSTSDDGYTTSYGYDAAGQRRTETIIDGVMPVTMQLDAEGHVASIGEGYGGAGPYTVRYAYNADDLPTTVTLPNGVSERAGYDANSALTSLTATGPNMGTITNTLNTAYGYGYNAAGWTTSTTTILGTDTVAHDRAGRLTDEAGAQVDNPTHAYHWAYDPNGNVTAQTADLGTTESYAYSPTQPNTLLQTHAPGYPNPDTYYGYDGNGDTTSITSPITGSLTAPGAINTHIGYDARQRVMRVAHQDNI